MKRYFLSLIILTGVATVLAGVGNAVAAQSNFQIAPPPIAYPYFEPGRSDGKIEPMYIGISAQDISLSGGGVNFDRRHAFSEIMAMDIQAGLFALSGKMPGISPITPNLLPGGIYYTSATDKAKVTMSSIAMSANIEFQPIHGKEGGLIIFGGPNIGIMSMEMKTPYSITYYRGGGLWGTATGYTDTLTISSTTSGFQLGLQGDISLSENFKLSPFIMTSSTSGTATMKDDPGMSGVSGYSSTTNIPATSSTSFGADIIIGNLSIGTVLQQIASQEKSSNDINVTMFRLGYHF